MHAGTCLQSIFAASFTRAQRRCDLWLPADCSSLLWVRQQELHLPSQWMSTCPRNTCDLVLVDLAQCVEYFWKTESNFWSLLPHSYTISHVKGKGNPYSIIERRVPELIPVLAVSMQVTEVSHKLGGRLPLLSARPAVTLATFRGLLPISLLGEQRHDGCG